MKIKNVVLIALAMLLSVCGMRAEGTNWSYNMSTILMSKYYGTIFGGTFYNGPMSFTDLVASRKNAFGNLTFDFSIGQKLDRLTTYNHDGGNEYDLTVDQTFKFGSEKYPVLIDVGAVYLALYNLKDWGDDAFSEYLRVDFPIRGDLERPLFQPYAQVYHYHLINDFRDKGWIGYAGIIRSQDLGLKLFGNKLALDIDYRLGVSGGTYDSHKGIEYHRFSFSLPVKRGSWTLVPTIIAQFQGGPDQTFVKKNEVFGSLFIKKEF
ncbi:MAG: hypothetical protein KBC33_03015 [Candidatus Pacebacteria bacterium]|nr:hypothetical protein [Candidatus Paceibacterota bacterium]